MKKLLSVLLVTVMVLTLLVGCGAKKDNEGSKDKVKQRK